MRHILPALILLLTPTQLFAFDFGFVRGPDWMDMYVATLLGVSLIGFLATVAFKPRGVPVNEMYLHFGEFPILGRIAYALFGIAFMCLLLMVFLGMGLQRAAEAGL